MVHLNIISIKILKIYYPIKMKYSDNLHMLQEIIWKK
jgi:hypothetical protein